MCVVSVQIGGFLSTLSLRRATEGADSWHKMISISIHALLAESDTHPITILVRVVISIHALLAESDFRQNYECFKWIKFLSTLSLRRATLGAGSVRGISSNFYPRSPCGERPTNHGQGASNQQISIHALLAESDDTSKDVIKTARNFYPRSPCGERQFQTHQQAPHNLFLSTLSLRRATHWQVGQKRFLQFLSTLSLRRATSMMPLMGSILILFLSTLSLRRATIQPIRRPGSALFLSTLSLRRATVTVLGIQHKAGISIHALLAESDFRQNYECFKWIKFLSTLSLRRATQ